METKIFVFRVRGIQQELELFHQTDKSARLSALKIFKERGFVDLELSEVKISK